jgi:hypothetical protein
MLAWIGQHPQFNGREDGKRHECRGAIILRYQQRTERVDEAILRFLSGAASRSIVILRVLASSAVIRVRAFLFPACFSATRLFGMKGAHCVAGGPFSRA